MGVTIVFLVRPEIAVQWLGTYPVSRSGGPPKEVKDCV